jgi:polyisoprenoid-binding protein YceI
MSSGACGIQAVKIINRVAMVLLLAVSADAMCLSWSAEPGQSTLKFTASFEGTGAPGIFHRFQVQISTPREDPAGGHLVVDIDVTSVDLFSKDLNEAVREPEWFDTARHPSARFESNEIISLGQDRFEARGFLVLKGARQAVNVPLNWRPSGKEAHLTGTLTLKRGAFGIGSGEWSSDDTIGQNVEISFDVLLETEG